MEDKIEIRGGEDGFTGEVREREYGGYSVGRDTEFGWSECGRASRDDNGNYHVTSSSSELRDGTYSKSGDTYYRNSGDYGGYDSTGYSGGSYGYSPPSSSSRGTSDADVIKELRKAILTVVVVVLTSVVIISYAMRYLASYLPPPSPAFPSSDRHPQLMHSQQVQAGPPVSPRKDFLRSFFLHPPGTHLRRRHR